MQLKDFEKKIQNEINKELRVVPHPHLNDVAGVYLNNVFITTIPSREIYHEYFAGYKDNIGNRHVTIDEAEGKIRAQLLTMGPQRYHDLKQPLPPIE